MLTSTRAAARRSTRPPTWRPNAVLCGDVSVGPDCRILFGAVLSAEGGPVELGERCIVMENAVSAATVRTGNCLGYPRDSPSGRSSVG